jgi:hypothetical protein
VRRCGQPVLFNRRSDKIVNINEIGVVWCADISGEVTERPKV